MGILLTRSWNDRVAAFGGIVWTTVLHALATGHSAFLDVAAFANSWAGACAGRSGGGCGSWCLSGGRGRSLFVSFLQFVVQEIRCIDKAGHHHKGKSKKCK